ncbi:MAG: universal stress protein [Acidobacteriaceae bacterium]|nr:universal stress protein [Acidobacteriaceae bacterium]
MIFQKKRNGSIPALQNPPALHFEVIHQTLPLTVVYTTIESTLAALRYAAELASQLEAQIRILMIQTVPYSLPIDRPQVHPDFRVRQFLTRSANEPIETRIDIRLCRDASTCLLEALQPQSLVLIGTHRRFWFAREKGWGKILKRAGHHVIFVGKGQRIKSLR